MYLRPHVDSSAGGRAQKHGDWLRGRRWSVMRSGSASSLAEAIDLSLSNMTPTALPLQQESIAGNVAGALPAYKMAVISELPHGQRVADIDEALVVPPGISEAFPRASRKVSSITAGMLYPQDDAEATSGGALSAAEAGSAAGASSAHDSRWELEESVGDKGSRSTDLHSCSTSQEAQLREELGIYRAGNMGVACILQARTHQWVSGMPTRDITPDLPCEHTQVMYGSASPGAWPDIADAAQSPVFIHMDL